MGLHPSPPGFEMPQPIPLQTSQTLERIARQLDDVKRGRLQVDVTMQGIQLEASQAIDKAKRWRVGAFAAYDKDDGYGFAFRFQGSW